MRHINRPVVIITGASEGLGAALARTLLEDGFNVAVCARRVGRLVQAVYELGMPDRVFSLSGDVADRAFRRSFVQQTAERFGRIDALVNNASTLGDTPLPPLTAATDANFRAVFETNVIAPVMCIQETLPWLTRQPRALVLGISSDAAVAGYPNWGVYGSSKAALDLTMRTLAAELPPSVASLTVDPGDMDTAMHHLAIPDDSGMASPLVVAEAMRPLFAPLIDDAATPFESGNRLTVEDGRLNGGAFA